MLNNNRIYERESMIWDNYPFNEDAKDYLVNWIEDRMIYLDNQFNRSTLSTADFSINKNSFVTYPNPTKENVTIESNFKFKQIEYAILSIQGVVVKQGNLNSNQEKLNVSNLSNGIYLLKVGDNDAIKIVKQ